MANMAIRLPKDPKDHDYEDQVAAMLLACGYYLETRLILKKGTEEVLEFDAIATPVSDYFNRRVVEVKSGSWGVSDLFKLYGQTLYTHNEGAWLIHKQKASQTKLEAISEVCKSVPVKTLYIDLQNESTKAASDDIPPAIEMPQDIRDLLFATAWWSRCADRVAQARFKQWIKSDTSGAEALTKARLYCAQLEASLFKDTPIRRADAMYDAYKEAPQLTSSLINHVAATSKCDLLTVRRSVTNDGERPHLQYIMSLEQKARIAIIKNAYDALAAEKQNAGEGKPWHGSSWDSMYKAFLPAAFKGGMRDLDENPHAQSAAFFLQVFIDVLGGFYFPDDPSDVALVSAMTGVPADHVPRMVGLLDCFFPIARGWVHKGEKGIHFIKGVPAYVRGAGCFVRESQNGSGWTSKNDSAYWTVKWHNALYRLLEPTLGASAGEAEA